MPDFAVLRRTMVDGQLRTFDITDQSVLAAMLTVPRERFVPTDVSGIAYLDTDIAVSSRRRLMTPMVFGKLLQTAEITPSCRVLDVGCAAGYSSAVLSQIAQKVVALDEDADLARMSRHHLSASHNVTVVEGPLTDGWKPEAPYDVIVVNGLCEVVPPELFDQLKEDGRLVTVVGSGPASKAMIYRRDDGKVTGRPVFDATGPRLPGFAKQPVFQF